jgi:hypothetical protein
MTNLREMVCKEYEEEMREQYPHLYGPEGHSISNWWVFCVSRFVPEKIKTVAIAVGELKLHTLSVESTVEKV